MNTRYGTHDYIWKTPEKIITIDKQIDVCPHCGQRIRKGFALIPISKTQKAKVPGVECTKCKTLFVMNDSNVRSLLIDNLLSKSITYNGQSLWNYSYKLKQKRQQDKSQKYYNTKIVLLSSIENSIVLFTVKIGRNTRDYVICNSGAPSSKEAIVLHYTTDLARELITAAYRTERNRKGKINGKTYKIDKIIYPRNKEKHFPGLFFPSEVQIKKGGGLGTQIKNNQAEIIDLLLFSPYTQNTNSHMLHFTKLKYLVIWTSAYSVGLCMSMAIPN